MAYENLSGGVLDYIPCRYMNSKLLFRGPKKEVAGKFVAMIGGTETYGKFIEKPYPALVNEAIGTECINFGCLNAGLDVFLKEPVIIEISSKARATVIQVVGAQNMSNRYYAVHPRRNDRFLRASLLLKSLFHEVDFTEFHFTKHMLGTLQKFSAERFDIVREELKASWISRMKLLINMIEGTTILLWFSQNAPEDSLEHGGLGHDPLFVDRAMIETIRPIVDEVVEVVPDAPTLAQKTRGMLYSSIEEPAAQELMGVGAHYEVARTLAEPLKRLI